MQRLPEGVDWAGGNYRRLSKDTEGCRRTPKATENYRRPVMWYLTKASERQNQGVYVVKGEVIIQNTCGA